VIFPAVAVIFPAVAVISPAVAVIPAPAVIVVPAIIISLASKALPSIVPSDIIIPVAFMVPPTLIFPLGALILPVVATILPAVAFIPLLDVSVATLSVATLKLVPVVSEVKVDDDATYPEAAEYFSLLIISSLNWRDPLFIEAIDIS
jgi:hypothetical protein